MIKTKLFQSWKWYLSTVDFISCVQVTCVSVNYWRICSIACHACLRANVVYVPNVPACQRGLRANVPACQKRANVSFLRMLNHVPGVPYVPVWSTCPFVHVPTCQKSADFSFLRANKRANVPKACQPFNLACQRAKRRAIFSTSPAKRRANFLIIFQNNCIFSYT